jgi:hypothetical protein
MLLGELNTVGLRFNEIYHMKFRSPGASGIKIMEEDWDNLIIIDGCRADIFEQTNEIKGELETKYSQGTESWEFLKSNFFGEEYHDTVYISANPHTSKLPEGTFHDLWNIYEKRWDESLQTVHPKSVVEESIGAHEMYPNKRLIIHFMQPHFPFIGEKGQEVDLQVQEGLEDYPQVWSSLRYRLIGASIDTIWDAYKENLNIVLSHVDNLLSNLDGQSVITSDHGNLVGERTFPVPVRGFGHEFTLNMDELLLVPWLFIPGEQREITSENPKNPSTNLTDKELDERLKALGYK